jgi:hypothetical protein
VFNTAQRLLFGIVAGTAAVDCVWASIRHFDIDTRGYLFYGLIAAVLWAGGWFYARVRKDDNLSGMLTGAGFLCGFSIGLSMLNYFLLTVAGPRIDIQLAAADRFFGIDWLALMAIAAAHPIINALLVLIYGTVLPQLALLIVCLGWTGRPNTIYRLCLSVAVGAAITVSFWTFFPSFGAFSVYDLPPTLARHMLVALDGHYAHKLVWLLANGPGYMTPDDIKGLIGFPSFHAALAMFAAWYAFELKLLRWPLAALNGIVLIATPIQGGHHVIDVVAGVAVAALSIALSKRIMRACTGADAMRVLAKPQPLNAAKI